MALYLEQGEELNPEQLHDPVRARAARRAPRPDLFRLARETGAGVARTARHHRAACCRTRPKAIRRPSSRAKAMTPSASRSKPDAGEARGRRTCSRSPSIRSSASWACSASTRAPCAAAASCSSAMRASPSRSRTCSSLQGKEHTEVAHGIPGDICAVAKVDEMHFDAVLHDSHDEDHFHLKSLAFPPPMFGLAIEPERRGEEQRLSDGLHKLVGGGSGVRVEHHASAERDGDLRHGRAAPADDARAHGRALRRARQDAVRRASRIARRSRVGRRPPPSQEADRRRRPVRRGVPASVEAAAARRGFRVRRRGRRRRDPRPVHPRGREGRPPGDGRRARSPATRCRTCASSSTTASTIRSTARKSRSSPPAARRSSTRSARPARSCSSRSCAWKSRAPRIQWATSPATSPPSAAASTATIRCPAIASSIGALVPLAELNEYQSRLKSLTGGEGTYTMELSHYDPVPAAEAAGAHDGVQAESGAGVALEYSILQGT